MGKKLGVLLTAAALAVPTTTMAMAGEEAVVTMDEVVVSAGRVEEKKREVSGDITVIDGEQLQRTSAATLGELLAEKGFGTVRQYPGATTAIGLRGFKTDTFGNELQGHVLILINGRRAGTGNAAKILTDNVERIEIIRGPASVQYGSSAMGGLINIIMKQGKDAASGFVGMSGGSNDYWKINGGVAGAVKDFDFALSLSKEGRGDYETAEGETYTNTGIDGIDSYSLNMGYSFNPKNRIGIFAQSYDGQNIGNPNYLSQNDLDDYKDSSLQSLDFTYNGATSDDRYSWLMRYFFGTDENTSYDPTGIAPTYLTKSDQTGAQAQVSTTVAGTLVTSGVDWVNYEAHKDPYAPQESEYDNLAWFMLAKKKVLDNKLIVSGGLRYDTYEVDLIEPAGTTADTDNLAPNIGLVYLVNDKVTIRANYGEAFAMPAAEEMGYDYLSWGTRYVGNPDLKPEKSKTYETGVEYGSGALHGTMTYFYTDYQDKIEKASGGPGIMTWENVGEAVIQGFEGGISYDVGALFDWSWEVKPYFDFVLLTELRDEATGEDLLYVPDTHFSYGIRANDLDGLSADLGFSYSGEQQILDYETGWPAQEITKDGYTVANLTISKRVYQTAGGRTLSVKGDILNLLDEDYAHIKGYPMPGRNFRLGLKYSF